MRKAGKVVMGVVTALVLALVVAGFGLGDTRAAPANKPLTNADVVNLVKVGLGEDIVIGKIKEARTVAFKTEVDDLLRLKRDGVKERIIAAMLERSTAAIAAASVVRLLTRDGEYPIDSIEGATASTYAYVTTLSFADYPGPKAVLRTTDRRPRIEIASKANPTGRFYIVKAESNKEGTRSVKLGSGGMFKFKSGGAPDKDWTIDYSVKEKSPGIWEIDLGKDLEPGEYGVWSRGRFDKPEQMSMSGSGVLYDFGVD